MYSLAALASFSLVFALHVPAPSLGAHEPALHAETPSSVLALVFDVGAEAPSPEAAQAAIAGSDLLEPSDESELWGLSSPAGLFELVERPFGDGVAKSLISKDRARFTQAELARVVGERLTLSLYTDLEDGGLPRLHQQIRDLVAAAKALGLGEPVALYDVSSDRWHPPGWVVRMAASEAGPAPSTVFQVHAVYDEDEDGERRTWIHSHGVARLSGYELGCVDVRSEHYEVLASVVELAAGFAVDDLDWPAGEPTPVLYGLELARLPWEEGVKALAPQTAGTASDHDEEHASTFVLAVKKGDRWECPGESVAALDMIVTARSNRETERGALAARETYMALRDWQRSTEMDHLVLVKAPVETEDGGREHCWFEVSRLRRSSVRATLVSQPMGSASLAPGDSTTLKVSELTGWVVQTETSGFGPDEFEALLVASSE